MRAQPPNRIKPKLYKNELLVALVIAAVLAALAIPLHGKYMRSARLAEATVRIGEIISRATDYAYEHARGTGPVWPSNSELAASLWGTRNFAYSITAGSGASATDAAFTVTATGRGAMSSTTVAVTVPNVSAKSRDPVIVER